MMPDVWSQTKLLSRFNFKNTSFAVYFTIKENVFLNIITKKISELQTSVLTTPDK